MKKSTAIPMLIAAGITLVFTGSIVAALGGAVIVWGILKVIYS